MNDLEQSLRQLPRFKAETNFKESLFAKLTADSQRSEVPVIKQAKNFSLFPRFSYVFAVLLILIGLIFTLTIINGKSGSNMKLPSVVKNVQAEEILRKYLDSFLKAGTIYHEKLVQTSSSGTNVAYEYWSDMDSARFRNYSKGSKTDAVWQISDIDTRWDINPGKKTALKTVYHFASGEERNASSGKRVDIVEKVNELIRAGRLNLRETTLNGKAVYIIDNLGPEDNLGYDEYYFDKDNYRLVRKVNHGVVNSGPGAGQKYLETVDYEIQEMIDKSNPIVKSLFEPPFSLSDYRVFLKDVPVGQRINQDNLKSVEISNPLTSAPDNKFDIYGTGTLIDPLNIVEYDFFGTKIRGFPGTYIWLKYDWTMENIGVRLFDRNNSETKVGERTLPEIYVQAAPYKKDYGTCIKDKCETVGQVHVPINGVSHDVDIVRNLNGNSTEFYSFQIPLKDVSFSIPGFPGPINPLITVSFKSKLDGQRIADYLSSFTITKP